MVPAFEFQFGVHSILPRTPFGRSCRAIALLFLCSAGERKELQHAPFGAEPRRDSLPPGDKIKEQGSQGVCAVGGSFHSPAHTLWALLPCKSAPFFVSGGSGRGIPLEGAPLCHFEAVLTLVRNPSLLYRMRRRISHQFPSWFEMTGKFASPQ